jgi:hypothetical protein
VVSLIDIDTELRETAEFLETLVIHQRGIVPSLVLVSTGTVNSGKQRA